MRRIPLINPAATWSEWRLDTGVAAVAVALTWTVTGSFAVILLAAAFGVQAGAALRLRRGGRGDG